MMVRNLFAAAAATLLVACASNQPAPQQPVASCVFADGSGQAAPEWVCGAPVNGVDLSAVGYADKSGAGPNFMKQMAATAARVELAQTMKVEVQNMIKQYAETTGAGDSETVDRVNTSVTKQITKETLVGSKIFRQMPTPSGGMVVLVGLDADTLNQLAEQALKTSMNNERALWQKFQAEKSFDELASEIANME
ncbi:LPP20 family lipoprotein [Bacterioplanoides sp. SCSIO 12839]|uniref:LPP20 family lipoprotein n=1 Tax=Bacterioplanoides sp. SCSIO 12839 TaxID=2829569 RepID=UPI002106BFE9|nr:LPP20 family lipoprotein [Bacterioplanoides sp. SCSIO 12839]UTW48653.1 LPP20 family lipoprotein [Bacterioplanoides sp. SCSIO 12839]